MVLEIEAINRKLQTVEEFSRLVPLEENVVEGEFDQMTDIIINKDFQFKFREAAEVLDEDSINLTKALAAKKLFAKPDNATGDAPGLSCVTHWFMNINYLAVPIYKFEELLTSLLSHLTP